MAAISIQMPQLGESVTEGTISRWLKKEGDYVAKDEPLVEIITDKVTAEIPSPTSGTLLKIIAQEGAAIEVGQTIALVGEAEQMADSQSIKAVQMATPEEPIGSSATGTASTPNLRDERDNGTRRSTPMVRRLAREHGIDLAKVQGTGVGGRITKEDIQRYIAAQSTATSAPAGIAVNAVPSPAVTQHSASTTSGVTSQEAQAPTVEGREADIPLTPMRRAIAEHMVRSKHTSPHALTVIEVDMTSVVTWRETIKDEFRRREGIELTYLPFVVKATVEALKKVPIINSSWREDRIVLRKDINVGIAVALENGLVVPVIHKADEKSIAGLAKAIADLSQRARANKLTLSDLQDGTFTVNNTGSYGSIISAPIINQPQAAILSMEAIQKRPVVINDAIAIRSMMYVCLSFDHRIIDGAVAGRFLQEIRRWLESFGPTTPLY